MHDRIPALMVGVGAVVWGFGHLSILNPDTSPQSNANLSQKVPAAAVIVCHQTRQSSMYLRPNSYALCRLSPPSWFSEQVIQGCTAGSHAPRQL